MQMTKGKAKAIENDASDLHQTLTYRHLLSTSLGVRDPLRVIALCDSDAFYAACEMVRLGVDKDVPLVVLQWDGLIAVNYPARTYGISRMDRLKDAKKRCPHLQVVHVATYKEGEKEPGYWDNVDNKTHKVSLDYYRRESAKIHALFKEMLPGAEIEKASIDEAFIDFTRPVRTRILERYPYVAQVPPDAPNGLDSPLPPAPSISWEGCGTPIPDAHPDAETNDTTADDSPDHETTWHDVALSIAGEMMAKARTEIHTRLGYTTSAGIARNKFLAKLSASYKKPMQQSILRNACIPSYLFAMPFKKIRFLGGKLGEAIAKEYEASTVGDLLPIKLEEIQQKFGENAIWVYEILRGIDRSEVKEKSALNKSMLASKNLPQAIRKASEGHHWIRVLAAELALRLNNARSEDPALWPKTLVLHIRRGYEASRSKQAPFPFKSEVTVDVISAAGDRLWKELVGSSDDQNMNINNVQLAFTGLDSGEEGQTSIEGFLKDAKRSRNANDDDFPPQTPPHRDSEIFATGWDHDRHAGPDDEEHSFTCLRCGKRLSLPASSIINTAESQDHTEEETKKALDRLRVEHADFHFAQDMVKITPSNSQILGSSVRKSKKPKASGDITRYLVRSRD